jgi:pimeloyl-ACP methyl ester carboxylesterase
VTPAPHTSAALAEGDDGTRLRVIVRRGDYTQVPFVLVHGLASNARLWDGVGERLQMLGHSSYAVDLRGHGESERPDHGYDFATVAGDVAAVVRDVVERRAVLVGQSWGGNVVLETAARYPELARAVACIDGGFIRLRDRYPEWEEARTELSPPSFRGMAADDLRHLMSGHLPGWPPAGIDAQYANFEELPDGTVRARLSLERHLTILEHLWRHDPDLLVAEIDVPVWILAVDDGRPGKRARLDRFSTLLASGRTTWAAGHHDIHAEQPDVVVDFLLDLAVGVSG